MADNATRRGFLIKVFSLLFGSVPLVSVLGGCATTGLAYYRGKMTRGTVSLMPPEFPELSEDGGAIQLEVENFVEPVVVVRLNEKDLIALSPVCTHLGCTVRKEPSFFRCPCHGSTYALDGTVVRGPAKQRLTVFRTERVDNRLLIYL